MNIVILMPVRLFGDGLVACLSGRMDISIIAIVNNFSALRQSLDSTDINLVLIDVTQGIDLDEVKSLAAGYPELAILALGLKEQRQEVVRHGRAGFSGYVPRDATTEELCKAILDAIEGRLVCSPEISGGLMRGLFRADPPNDVPAANESLTRREEDVLKLIGGGLSNKEIARELNLSVATVKHHVHHVLEKLHLPCRTHAMRKVRDAPWLVGPRSPGAQH